MKPKRRCRPFVDLEPASLAATAPASAGLFLDRFDAAALRGELEAAGILAALGERGYPELVLRIDLAPGEHRLRLLQPRGRVSLVDLRVAEVSSIASDPLLLRRGLHVQSFLIVHWLALQDPRAHFTQERPRLPGQRYPGLGLGKRLYEQLLSWSRNWGKDGLLSVPEYFHNAVFYSSLFRFLSPLRQGRFEALRRDLAALHVAEASAAVEDARVVEDPGGRRYRWEPGEMVAPITDGLRAYLESEDYARAAASASTSVRYRLVG
jgi:hypothetical protein